MPLDHVGSLILKTDAYMSSLGRFSMDWAENFHYDSHVNVETEEEEDI